MTRWAAFDDAEIEAILREMTTDDGCTYAFSVGDEPAYSIVRELEAEIVGRAS